MKYLGIAASALLGWALLVLCVYRLEIGLSVADWIPDTFWLRVYRSLGITNDDQQSNFEFVLVFIVCAAVVAVVLMLIQAYLARKEGLN